MCVVRKQLQRRRSTEDPDQQSRSALVSKELQTTTLSLSTKQSLFKHRYTLREGERARARAGCFSEVKQAQSKVYQSKGTLSERTGCFCELKVAFLYRLKGAFKEYFAGRRGWVTGDHYLIDSPELCNKFTAACSHPWITKKCPMGGGGARGRGQNHR